jgi:hypothetical protein
MRLKEFANSDAQLELWKMVSDAVWSAIKQQNNKSSDSSSSSPPTVSRAQDAKSRPATATVVPKVKASAKKVASVKLPKIPTPPPKPRKPLKAKPKAKPKQVGMTRTQVPALPISQRQQPIKAVKPPLTAQQPLPAKTPNFNAKTGVIPQNRRVPVSQSRRG